MEINVTTLVNEVDCFEFAHSRFEGGQHAGQNTWNASKAYAQEHPLVTYEQQEELRSWIREFGAWSDEDISAMSDVDTNALLLQFVAGDIREMEGFDSYEEYQAAAESGQCSGRLYKADIGEHYGDWFYYVGC